MEGGGGEGLFFGVSISSTTKWSLQMNCSHMFLCFQANLHLHICSPSWFVLLGTQGHRRPPHFQPFPTDKNSAFLLSAFQVHASSWGKVTHVMTTCDLVTSVLPHTYNRAWQTVEYHFMSEILGWKPSHLKFGASLHVWNRLTAQSP